MTAPVHDPLELGQKLVAVLETGARVATYKLATLMALIEYSVENLPLRSSDALRVSIDALALRVIELYWPQLRPFDDQVLRQSSASSARIIHAVRTLRAASGAGAGGMAFPTAQVRAPGAVEVAIREVGLTLVRQPLHRLQRLPGASGETFLFDDSWMHDKVSRATVQERGGSVILFPGVAHGLARLSGLLRPALEMLWVEDVRRLNQTWLGSDVPDVAGHLFGRERLALAPARAALRDAFGPACFYCGRNPDNPEVDHVLPWSRVGIDGLANLVLACRRCNGNKLNALPSTRLVGRVLDRDRAVLEQAGEAIVWPTQYDRVRAAARGIYRGEPAGTMTWDGVRRPVRLDIAFAPGWMRVEL